MKYFVIILATLITGCTATHEGYDFLGTTPYYAVKAPHPATCACCFGKKSVDTPHYIWHTNGLTIEKGE